jgi:ATP-binding protein involved in chromosome partitioning
MPNTLEARVAAALTSVRNPRVDNDVISAGMVRDLSVGSDGVVAFTFVLSREDPAPLVREARKTVQEVEGVRDVRIQVVEPRHEPGTGAQPAAGRPAAPPAAPELVHLGRIIAISSGKGGVGKSTVASNLAVALAESGQRVGLMDADVHGPNIPRMFGVSGKPPVEGGKIVPLAAHGVKLISLGLMLERDQAAIWRGPIVMKIIQQFLRDVDWGKLDYLIVDLPPGTGDAQLSLVQSVQVQSAIIVTTPQEMAVGDALRGAKMFERVNVPVLGIVENMSFFSCPHCGKPSEIFLAGGGARLAGELGIPLLGQVPLQARMADDADAGKPVVVAAPDSPAAHALRDIAKEVQTRAGARSISLPILTG